jgi:hypothetical protein
VEKTWKPTTAGILSIISGAIGICMGSLAILFARVLTEADWRDLLGKWGMWRGGIPEMPMLGGVFHLGSAIITGAGIALIVVSVIALIGGIYALKRKIWGLALAGSILAVAGGGPMGVLAIIFVTLGRKEFS